MAETKNNIASELQNQLMEIPEQHEVVDTIEDIHPVQDSPKNILNILNDYCIQAILLKVDNILDFYNAAKVCTRFQKNAQTVCFPFKDILFEDVLKWTGDNEGKYPIPRQCAEDFFSIFGQFVKSIMYEQIDDTMNYMDFDEYSSEEESNSHMDHINRIPYKSEKIVEMNVFEDVDLIQNYCGKNLVKLDISAACECFCYLNSKFESLEELSLNSISATSANLFPKLKELNLSHLEVSNVNFIANKFPHLKKLWFLGVEQFNNKTFIEFQIHNPQLEELGIYNCEHLTSLVWQDIGKRLPNLVRLNVFHVEEIDKNMLDLCTLEKLRELTLIKFDWCDSLKPLFDLFVDKNLLIEKLSINNLDNEAAISLQKLKMIKNLTISETSNEIVIDIVKELPALEHLEITVSYYSTDQWIIDEILQHASKLTKFRLNGTEIRIDVNE